MNGLKLTLILALLTANSLLCIGFGVTTARWEALALALADICALACAVSLGIALENEERRSNSLAKHLAALLSTIAKAKARHVP